MTHAKLGTRQLLSLLLALTLAFGLVPATAMAAEDADVVSEEVQAVPVAAEEAAESKATFTNTTGDGGDDVISLTLARTFEARIPVADDVAAENAASIVWSLVRDTDKPYISTELYPNQKMEAELSAWTTNSRKALFPSVETSVAADEDGQNWLTLNLEADQYFATAPHANGGSYLENCGYFDLVAKLDGEEIGSVAVKIVPYDTFRTMDEVYQEIDDMVAFAAANTDLYVKKDIMGQSSGAIYDPLDIPYLIVAKDQSVVKDWLAFTDAAETNPTQVLADIAAGKYDDIKVPVMYSNIHSNEVAAVDGILEFAWMLLENAATDADIPYDVLTGFTAEGQAQYEAEKASRRMVEPDLIKESASWLGWLQDGNGRSGIVDLEKYYDVETRTVTVDDLLEDVFFILVPEENVEGRTYITRTASSGYDLNRDNSFQTTSETQAMQKLIGTFNPVSLTEFHGQVTSFQCEPCDPPHEPNFEYDLLAEHLMAGGEALGIAAVANNEAHNSYVIPQRDYLIYPRGGTEADAVWDVWDDMSTSYTPQFAMLHGTVAYTVELPSYTDAGAHLVQYGCLGQSAYIAGEKLGYLTAQTKIYERGVTNFNSDAYELVGQWLADQYDVEGAEMDIFRPEYEENGNFYPECYIIPMDGENQSNLQAAYDMMEWLSRNDVKILVTKSRFTYDGVTYPIGTMIIDLHQAKRSVANSALYNGTLIQNWSTLYSEGITAFNKTRGFDMVTVADPKAYAAIKPVCGSFMDYDACVSYLKSKGSYFDGVTRLHVVISNVSEDSTAAVNDLLKAGAQVGMVTDETSEFYGDFVCSYEDWETVSDRYVLSGTGLAKDEVPEALVISKAPVVYITGASAQNTSGFVWTSRVGNANWNYDRVAMALMNFATTSDVAEADVVLGASALSGDAQAAVLAGKPYIGYGSNTRSFVSTLGVTRSSVSGAMDCLGYVVYPNTTLVNASYVMDGDDILYGYGVGYYTNVPADATVLVQMDSSKTPLEGFIPTTTDSRQAAYEAFMNSVQGFAYEGEDANGNQVNVVLFANSLTNKAHQRDEYAFISNFIFSNLLDEEQAYDVDSVPDVKPNRGTTVDTSRPGTLPGTSDETCAKDDTCPLAQFADLDVTAWYHDGVHYCLEAGLMNGVSDAAFAPTTATSRAMIATILWRLEGEPQAKIKIADFTDVAADSWYTEAVRWAAEQGIVQGYGDGRFGPEDTITREQLAAVLYRYAKAEAVEGTLTDFADGETVSDWAAEAMTWAVEAGIITGKDGRRLDPQGTATRAEVATILQRFGSLDK